MDSWRLNQLRKAKHLAAHREVLGIGALIVMLPESPADTEVNTLFKHIFAEAIVRLFIHGCGQHQHRLFKCGQQLLDARSAAEIGHVVHRLPLTLTFDWRSDEVLTASWWDRHNWFASFDLPQPLYAASFEHLNKCICNFVNQELPVHDFFD